jgi:chorismate-pyruvate lyase
VISPLSRILLAAEGTVTSLLEAYLLEPMDVIILGQQRHRLERPLAAFGLPRGAEILDRQILLVGRKTRTPYLYAASRIALDHLDGKVRDALLETHKSLGWILQEHRVETTWNMLGYRLKKAGRVGPLLGLGAGAPLLHRTYRISVRGLPTFRITEEFSPDLGLSKRSRRGRSR